VALAWVGTVSEDPAAARTLLVSGSFGLPERFYTQLGCGVSRKMKDGWEQKEKGKTWAAWLDEFAAKHGLQKAGVYL